MRPASGAFFGPAVVRRYSRGCLSSHAPVDRLADVQAQPIIPFGLFVWAAIAQSDAVIPLAKTGAQKVSQLIKKSPTESLPVLRRLPSYITDRVDTRSADVRARLADSAQNVVGYAAAAGTALAKNAVNVLLDLFVLLFALFFFFRDGPVWYAEAGELLPLNQDHKRRLDRRIHATIIGVVRGTFITSVAQSAVATLAFFIIGLPGALVLGFMTFIATIIPTVGTALIWVPVALYFLFAGPLWKGLFMVAAGVFGIGLIDNIVRPLVVRGDSELPFFWLFFAILGGLQVFGMMGVLLGPLMIAVMPILFDIYRTRYLHGAASS
jgi:predicted PurR-regulated permease PerM